MAPHMLNHGTRRRWVVNFKPRKLSPRGKSSRYSLTRGQDGPHSWSDVLQQEKKSTIPALSNLQPRHYTNSYCSGETMNIYTAKLLLSMVTGPY